MIRFKVNRIGKVYNRLTVIDYVGFRKRVAYWKCECICGAIVIVQGGNLQSGSTKSCGCLLTEKSRQTMQIRFAGSDKRSNHPLYDTWRHMHDRCINADHQSYKWYGGRGIYVDVAWNDFWQFIEDMGPKPSSEYSLERKNNNGPYSKSNCKWATVEEQHANKRQRKPR